MAKMRKQYDTLIARYTVTSVLGGGGAGQVLAVRDETGIDFALKVLTGDRIPSDKLKRFRNEIAFCKRNVHEAIIRILDDGFVIDNDVKVPFYVMPQFEGTLRKILRTLEPDDALRLFVKILDGVEAAHLNGVWHRDLKPENILVGSDPSRIVVADFGIAHFSEDLLHTCVETRDDAKLANFIYAAPEQRQRGAAVDHRADIFALGLMLNELFTGEVPLGKDHKTIGSVVPQFGYLDGIVDEMLRQAPEARPASIAVVKQQLIGRGIEYAVQQKILHDREIVVPVSTPPSVPEISFASFDYQKGRLLITLDRDPPEGWMSFFNRPPRSHSGLHGYGPEAFSLRGRTLSIAVPENLVGDVVEFARGYARMATEGLATSLAEEAKQKEHEERAQLKARIAEEEKRARILAKLNKMSPG